MSTMYISEFTDFSGPITPIPMQPSTDQTPVTFTATAGTSAAFQNNTRMVRVHVDGIASIKFGTNPTAVTQTQMRMVAGDTRDFLVPMGFGYKVSAVTST